LAFLSYRFLNFTLFCLLMLEICFFGLYYLFISKFGAYDYLGLSTLIFD